jgi:hypothetical protein
LLWPPRLLWAPERPSGGAAIAAGGDDDGTDSPITGSALDHATAAALEHTGGGRVTGTEVGDEES